jgi:hypothetical protein
MLQEEGEFPDFLPGHLGQKFAVLVAIEIPGKIVDTSDDHHNGICTIAFG